MKESVARGNIPRKALFSPENNENKKRRSSISPQHENENRRKFRRLESPTKLPKSQSFSIASTSSVSIHNESFKKQLFTRTQSEIFPQACTTLGYKEPMTSIVTKVRFSYSYVFRFTNYYVLETSLVGFKCAYDEANLERTRKVQGIRHTACYSR